jgi:hypothetical protein
MIALDLTLAPQGMSGHERNLRATQALSPVVSPSRLLTRDRMGLPRRKTACGAFPVASQRARTFSVI